jgi:hypothetical protein
MCATDKPQLARQVLSYLAANVEAQDTFEGIVEWWLLEQQIKSQSAEIREVLDDLAARRLVIERRAGDSRIHYRINRGKLKEVQELLAESDDR